MIPTDRPTLQTPPRTDSPEAVSGNEEWKPKSDPDTPPRRVPPHIRAETDQFRHDLANAMREVIEVRARNQSFYDNRITGEIYGLDHAGAISFARIPEAVDDSIALSANVINS